MKKRFQYFCILGVLAFLLVLQSKAGDVLAAQIENKKSEVRATEKEITALKMEINSLFSSSQIKAFAEDTLKMKLTNPTSVLTLEARGRNYSVKGRNFNIIEQIMAFLE